ncbi:MAG: secretin N-terminal domain-containing protein, partial [Gemmatimonadaceae bacterium]
MRRAPSLLLRKVVTTRLPCFVMLAMLTVLTGAPMLHAQAVAPPRSVNRTPSGVELNFQDTDLRVVISALAEIAGINLVYSNLPSRTVTLRTGGPIAAEEVRSYLESVIRANGLVMTREGSLMRVTSAPETLTPPLPVERVQTGATSAEARLFVYRLKHADAERLAPTVAALFGGSTGGGASGRAPPRALSDELRRGRIAPSNPTDLRPTGREFTSAGIDEGGLTASVQGSIQVVPDPRTNSLLIRASRSDYESMRSAIAELDTRPIQVLIEVLIAEVRRDRTVGSGVSVNIAQQALGDRGTTIGGVLAGSTAGDIVVRVLQLGSIKADVVLSALASSADITILSRPVILAQNNEEARILVGSERPFIQLFRSLPTDGAVRDQVVQYRNVGTQLTIRPTINPDGYVSMAVLQEVSTATAETQFGAPVISTREVKTQLLVKDGQTAALGGLIDQQRERTSSGIPFLKDIPVIGGLFRTSSQRRRGQTELFIFITPRVLRTDDDMTR